ncbi:YpiB family protein [Vagococcus sp. JNUCC 83]
MANLEDKRAFVKWLIESVTLKEKEAYWILNYLLNHDAILNRVELVEKVDKTPRGLMISDNSTMDRGMVLFIDNQPFTDAQQIFHDIRMKYKEPLYLEVSFSDREFNELYQTVLEENPFLSVFDTLSEEMVEKIANDFREKQYQLKLNNILEKLNSAIDTGDKEAFIYWSSVYQKEKNKSDK